MNSPSITPDRSDATSNNKILLDHHLRRSQTIASVVLGVGGGYTDAVVAAIEVQAAQKVADAPPADAIEAVAGLLSRAFGDAEVEADDWARQAITPFWFMQVGRSLVREGASLSVITMTGSGELDLVPAAFWNFEALNAPGGDLEADWHARVTTYGPSSSYTRLVGRNRLVYLRWGTHRAPATAAKGRRRGRTPPPASKAKPNAASPTKQPGRSPNSSLSPKTAATPTTTATRSPDCAPTSPEREAKHSSWRPPPPAGAKAAQAPRNATGRPHDSAR